MTTFTYAVTGTPVSPATTATSLSAKVAPLGWEKPFSATHKAAYRSKNPQSPQNILLIDNSLKTPNYTTGWAKWANVGIVEDLSDNLATRRAPTCCSRHWPLRTATCCSFVKTTSTRHLPMGSRWSFPFGGCIS